MFFGSTLPHPAPKSVHAWPVKPFFRPPAPSLGQVQRAGECLCSIRFLVVAPASLS